MAKNSEVITVQFNRKPFVFRTKAALTAQVQKAAKSHPAPDAKAKNLKHSISLPGLKAPTSLQWVAKHLFDTDPIAYSVVSDGEKQKGAYHPAQVLAAASKLAPFGVKASSTADSPRYAPWSASAAKALAAMQKAAKKTAPAKKVTAKKVTAKKAAAKKVTAK